MPFDINGARQAGYTDDEIADHLAKQSDFDIQKARQSGYSSGEILQHLSAGERANSHGPVGEEPEPGMLTSFGAGVGQRFGNTVLGGQKLLGKGIRAADEAINGRGVSSLVTGQPESMLGKAGQWLVDDADQGQSRLKTENSPYQAANPISNSAGSVASDVLVTWPFGGAVGKGISAVGKRYGAPILERLGSAVSTSGLRTGSVPISARERATDLSIRAVGGAVNGGVSTAVVSPEDVGTGAAVGGALPVALAGAGKAGRVVGAAVTRSGGQRAAVDAVAKELGSGGIPQVINDIQSYKPRGAENIPVSAAARTQSPVLARMEQGSRLRRAPQWYDFDQTQGKAVYDNLLKATADADDLGNRFANRAANWAKNWTSAETATKPRVWVKRMGQLGNDIQQALKAPEASEPAVRRALEELRDEVIRVGKGFSPPHLQKIRAQFNGKANPMDPSAFKSAPRENIAIRSLIAEMDDILNHTTNGRWDKVKQGYAEDSAKVHAAKASQQLRDKFVDQQTGRVRGVSLDPNGDIPKITEAGLGRAVDAVRLPNRSLALDPAAEQRVSATIAALRGQGIVQGVKRSSVAGGGSDTVSNAISMAPGSGSVKTALGQAIAAIHGAATARKDEAMANLFANPDQLAQALLSLTQPATPSAWRSVPYRAAPLIATDR